MNLDACSCGPTVWTLAVAAMLCASGMFIAAYTGWRRLAARLHPATGAIIAAMAGVDLQAGRHLAAAVEAAAAIAWLCTEWRLVVDDRVDVSVPDGSPMDAEAEK